MSLIDLHLEGAAHEPGARLSGEVEVSALSTEESGISVSLLWYTAGKGTEDIQVVERLHLEVPAAKVGKVPFSFELPEFPWSFSGTLVSLIWAVEAGLEPNGAVDRVEIVIAPKGQEIVL